MARGRCSSAWAGVVLAIVACRGTEFFVCQGDGDCVHAGNGVCQPNGFCSFPDAECDSGQRYGEAAAGGFAGTCVEEEATATTGPTTGASTLPDDATSGPLPTGTLDGTGDSGPAPTGGPVNGSTDGGSTEGTSRGGSDSTAAGESTAGVEACQVVLSDSFDGMLLMQHWTPGGAVAVTVQDGELRFSLDADANDYGNVVSPPFKAESASFVAEISLPPTLPFTQFLISFEREGSAESLDLLVEEGGAIARHWQDDSFVDVGAGAWSDSEPFLRLVELDGSVRFETSSDGQTFDTFYTYELDIRSWDIEFAIWAGTWMGNAESEVVAMTEVTACAIE
ncbi:MAG: hypothetical protein AAF721_15850 [Myxococcota bacterium]